MTKRSAPATQAKPRTEPMLTKTKTGSAVTHQQHSKVEVSILQQHVDRLPHEMDESADHQASVPREIIKQAAADVSNGLKDTDRGAQVNWLTRNSKRGSPKVVP